MTDQNYLNRLDLLLSEDLNFQGQNSTYASHNFHAFAAKFPPQIPAKFICGLTEPGDIVLDPMVGSGTTMLEAYLSGRVGVGFDIDPLALMISKVKVTALNVEEASSIGRRIIKQANIDLSENRQELEALLKVYWDSKTKEFIDYWFEHNTQVELISLLREIRKISDIDLRRFFELTLSGTIITKSGGVSLALDLAHTRPHRAKQVMHKADRVKEDNNTDVNDSEKFSLYSTKYLHSAVWEFSKKFQQNLISVPQPLLGSLPPRVEAGNAKHLPLDTNSVDLIVTSPPYPSNAIDYMRAHKFSLVWLGFSIDDLSKKRQKYIGSDTINGIELDELPLYTAMVVNSIMIQDKSKALSLHRYYSEMTQVLKEFHRVLKPGKSAIVVVGNSRVRGIETDTAECLKEIGLKMGFSIPKIGLRKLDRNRRMMPAEYYPNLNSQIQQRMHEEQVIGFYKSKS